MIIKTNFYFEGLIIKTNGFTVLLGFRVGGPEQDGPSPLFVCASHQLQRDILKQKIEQPQCDFILNVD